MSIFRSPLLALLVSGFIGSAAHAQLKSVQQAESLSKLTGRPIFAMAGQET
jgi:hypothetical protein